MNNGYLNFYIQGSFFVHSSISTRGMVLQDLALEDDTRLLNQVIPPRRKSGAFRFEIYEAWLHTTTLFISFIFLLLLLFFLSSFSYLRRGAFLLFPRQIDLTYKATKHTMLHFWIMRIRRHDWFHEFVHARFAEDVAARYGHDCVCGVTQGFTAGGTCEGCFLGGGIGFLGKVYGGEGFEGEFVGAVFGGGGTEG